MRTGFLMTALLLLAAPAQAADHPRSTYVTLVLQAFAAKIECPGTDVVYQDLVQKAEQMQLPEGTTEKVRKAIAWMHTGGKMGEQQDDDLMAEVAVATPRHAQLVRGPEDQPRRPDPQQGRLA